MSDKMELVRELNELSVDTDKNLERMKEIASVLLRDHFAPRNDYEHKDLKVCEYWLQNIKCRECLFDTLCNLKKNNMELSSQD